MLYIDCLLLCLQYGDNVFVCTAVNINDDIDRQEFVVNKVW